MKKISVFSLLILCCCSCLFMKDREGHIYADKKPILSTNNERVIKPYPFFARFFANPEPDRIPSALQRVQEAGDFNDDQKAIYVASFITGALQLYPKELSTLERKCSRFILGSGRDTLSYAFWCANTPEAYIQLKTISSYNPNASDHFLGRKAPIFLPETIESVNDLNIYWGMFHATGDLKYLNTILKCTDENVYRKHTNIVKNYVGNVAIETLTYNAILDQFVFDYIKEYADSASKSYQYDLDKVINYTTSYLEELEKKKNNPNHVLPTLFDPNKVGGAPILTF